LSQEEAAAQNVWGKKTRMKHKKKGTMPECGNRACSIFGLSLTVRKLPFSNPFQYIFWGICKVTSALWHKLLPVARWPNIRSP